MARPLSLIFRPMHARKENWLLKLYISGTGHRGRTARANLERICQQQIQHDYGLR
jgi:hypothetical protein